MSGIPQRSNILENFLLKNWQEDNIAALSYKVLKEEFSPFTDVRATSEYRLQVSANLIKRLFCKFRSLCIEDFKINLASVSLIISDQTSITPLDIFLKLLKEPYRKIIIFIKRQIINCQFFTHLFMTVPYLG